MIKIDSSYIVKELPSETRYSRKGIGKDRSDGRRGRRRKQLLDGSKETRGYWELKEEALDRTLWRTGFRRGYMTKRNNSG